MRAQRRHLQLALDRTMVQHLDVGDDVFERQPTRVELAVGERVEHERVVGIRAVADADFTWLHKEGSPKLVAKLTCGCLV